MGNGRVGDVGLIGRVVQNGRAVLVRVVDPTLQHFLRCSHAGGVIGIAQINQIDALPGEIGNEIVLRSNRKINQSAVAAGGVCRTCVAGHHIGIHVDRVNGVQDGDHVIRPEDIQNIS